MSLQQTYTNFLASPSVEALSSSPSMHFITTLITVNSAEAITKYLSREQTQLKKRIEKPLAAIENADSLVLEMETEMEFTNSGGNYLPALDDNFLADQVVMVPIVHIVNFEGGLIKQIRLYWDQSCLLKQIGVIGRTGRNWPIKDGRDQCKLIGTSVLGTTNAPGATQSASVSQANGNGGNVRTPANRKSSTSSNASSSHPTRDPHRSLSLFTPQEEEVERIRGPNILPRGSAKPPSRDLHEILGASEDGKPLEMDPRENVVAPKGQNGFSAQRTFEIGSSDKTPKAKDRTVILDPKKFKHFEFSDEPVASLPNAPIAATKHSKHTSTWDFEGFSTPEKVPLKHRKDDERHFGWSDEDDVAEPIRLPKKVGPRKDAETHFSFKDEATPDNRTKIIRPSHRGVDSHFEIADNSPVGSRVRKETSMNRKAANNNMASHWGENESPGGGFFDSFGKEQQASGIAIAGDGIGTRKAQGREWDFDEEVPDERKENITLPSRTARSQTQSSAGSNYWDQNY